MNNNILTEILQRLKAAERALYEEYIEPGPFWQDNHNYNTGIKSLASDLIRIITQEPLTSYWVMQSPYGHYEISTSGHHGRANHVFIMSFFTKEIAEDFCDLLNNMTEEKE
jgi:hypothetical protein